MWRAGAVRREVGRRLSRVRQVGVPKEVGAGLEEGQRSGVRQGSGTGLGREASGRPGGGRCCIAGSPARAVGQPRSRGSRRGAGGSRLR